MYHAACKVDFQPFNRSYSQLAFFNVYSEAREARSAEPFLFFQGKNHIGSHTRVGCLERLSMFVCVCVYVCVSQHFFRPRLSTALNVHGSKASSDGSRARTNNGQLFSNWFRSKSLRVRRGGCGNVCFHRHQKKLGSYHFFRVFKTSYRRTRTEKHC